MTLKFWKYLVTHCNGSAVSPRRAPMQAATAKMAPCARTLMGSPSFPIRA